MKLELIPFAGNINRIREIWISLEESVDASYFLSWGWMENWLSSLPDRVKPELAVFLERKEPRLAFFLGKASLVRKHLFRSRGWFVNATGIPDFDRVTIEYNGFLCKEPSPQFAEIIKSLPDSWDELYLPGLDIRSFPGTVVLNDFSPYRTIIDEDHLSPYVDLDAVRARGGDYLSLLSANTRAQINRSYRLCEATAPVRLEFAHDTQSAMDIYRELVSLHGEAWAKRSKEGVFSSDYMFQFHSQLIQKRFEYREIQLLRIKHANDTIGCLYNFVYKGNVCFYQSGINYTLDKRLKPGLVAHVEAIRHNAVAGHKTYDFLGGANRYKMSLATHHNRLIWVRVQKPLFRFSVENGLKRLKHLLMETHKKSDTPPMPGEGPRLRGGA